MQDKLMLGDLEVDIFKLCNIDRPFLVKMMQHLKSEYFESEVLKTVFTTYKRFFEQFNRPPDKKVLINILTKMGKFAPDLVASYTDTIYKDDPDVKPGDRDYITKEVVKLAKRSRAIEAIRKSVDVLENSDDFDQIYNLMKEALSFDVDTELGYDLYDVDARYKSLRESLQNRITTGFTQIDEVLDGGWAKKELYAFQSPPGVGKTIWLVNVGLKAMIGGHNVIHYSLEMSEDRLGLRYDGVASSINIRKLPESLDEIKEKYDMIKKITKSHLKMKEFPTALATILDIEAHMEQLKLKEDFNPDILIVDYGDILRSTHKANNPYEEQGWIFRELRGLAVKKNVAVITATQSNRDSLDPSGGTKEIIGMDKTADSMEKNRVLDVLFSIVQSRAERDDGKINLWVAKNRNGKANQQLDFLINYLNMQIREVNMSTLLKSSKGDKTDKSNEESQKEDE